MTDEARSSDPVILRANRDGASEVVQLSRATAEARARDLEADGWTCQTIEIDPPDPPS